MRNKNEKPSDAEYGLTRSYFARMGVSQVLINEYLPPSLNKTKTRGEIADNKLLLVRALR